MSGFELPVLVVIGTDCTASCKSNYHTIMTITMSTCVDRELRGSSYIYYHTIDIWR